MTRWAIGITLPAIAACAVAIAVWAGSNLAIALPASVAAVAAASLLFAEAFVRRPTVDGGALPPPEGGPAARLRDSLRSGTLGHESIVDQVDRLERSAGNPGLPVRLREELEQLARLPPGEFLRYLDERLDRIEEGS